MKRERAPRAVPPLATISAISLIIFAAEFELLYDDGTQRRRHNFKTWTFSFRDSKSQPQDRVFGHYPITISLGGRPIQ